MTRRLAAPAALALFCLAGCDRPAAAPQTPAATDEPAVAAPSVAPVEAAADPAPVPAAEALPAAPGAPSYAALYPGAEPDAPAVVGTGEAGDGGLVTFQTAASPDDVVAFYRQRAEDAGLRTMMGMNQGDARAYGAADEDPGGPQLKVVAAPGEEGRTSVQLSWSEGQ